MLRFNCNTLNLIVLFCGAVFGSFVFNSHPANGQDAKVQLSAERAKQDSSAATMEFVGLERAFSGLRFDRPVLLTNANDGSGRIFVVEQDGVIQVFSGLEERPTTSVFLDIRERISRVGNEEGLIGVAFHPDFKNNGRVYVHYSSKRDQGDAEAAPNIVASFQVSTDDPNKVDVESEQVIFTQSQPYRNHNGGMIAFGQDGYLYISLGDGGSANDPHGNGQNVETLLGSICRIDVDKKSKDKQYSIPADNPFLKHEHAQPELFAIGLRNVWRFSFDRVTGELWAADVGQGKWEEVNVVQSGGNYGWNRIEAKEVFQAETELATETQLEPVAIYGHEWGGSITGGNVYRGKRFPQLVGSYFYGDYMTGNLWQCKKDEEGNYQSELIRRTGRSIASFGEDEAGEVYLCSFDGGIYRITPTNEPEATLKDWPEDLADTGLYTSIPGKKVSADLIPYTVNAPFWSDNASKQRFISLPEGAQLGYRADGTWEVPVGTTIVKNFGLGQGRRVRNLETRLIKRTESGWESATYVWDNKNKGAKLQPNGKQFELWSRQGVSSWHAPSSSECSSCHVDAAGYVLGLNTAQLNRDAIDADQKSVGKNQIELWAEKGLIDLPADFNIAQADKFCSPADESADLQERARVWLDVNCAMCHRPQGPGNANIDLRYDTPLDKTKMVGEKPSQGSLGIDDAMLVCPGSPDRSLMLERIKTLGQGRMPNIGSNKVDPAGVKILTDWIKSLDK